MNMDIGKVPNDILKSIVLDRIKNKRKEVIVNPGIGEDCAALDLGDNFCIVSSDPITGTSYDIGRLAVHVSCNDIASSGAEPVGIVVTLLLPKGTSEKQLEEIMGQICHAAGELNIDILGGHTEITDAVNRYIISGTCIGKVPQHGLVVSSGARPGDFLVMTKSAGIEGTAIIASEKEEELSRLFGKEFVERAKGLIKNISVVREGLIAGRCGATAMHDVTEGGLLGALWEMAEASSVGLEVEKDSIPIEEETKAICEHYSINPLKLISSGCMLIACKDGMTMVKALEEAGIKSRIIGRVSKNGKRVLIDGKASSEILPPEPDELYKVIRFL